MSTSEQSTAIRLSNAIIGGITLSLTLALFSTLAVASPLDPPSSLATRNDGLHSHSLERRSSPVDQRCIARYNTSRADPFPSTGYFNPANNSGSMISIWKDGSGTPGEPINAIISGNSDPQVLCPEGFMRYATSINFGVSCLGNANGTAQYANLGDGFGDRIQGNGNGDNGVLRWNYGDLSIGTCRESIEGDNHFRWWLQNGTEGFSGAIFLAVSMEESAALGHKIQLDGYNRGRDYLVGNATREDTTGFNGYVFSTRVEYVEAGVLLNATSEGINHPDVAAEGRPVQDGRVAVLTVRQLSNGGDTSNDAAALLRPPRTTLAATTGLGLVVVVVGCLLLSTLT